MTISLRQRTRRVPSAGRQSQRKAGRLASHLGMGFTDGAGSASATMVGYKAENGGLEASRKRRNANPEPSRKACRRWYRKNRQKVLDAMHQRRMAVDAGYVSDGFVDWLTEQPCAYCAADGPSEIDHVVPVSRGGDHDEMNLVPACRRCNASKGSRLLSEWKEG